MGSVPHTHWVAELRVLLILYIFEAGIGEAAWDCFDNRQYSLSENNAQSIPRLKISLSALYELIVYLFLICLQFTCGLLIFSRLFTGATLRNIPRSFRNGIPSQVS